MQKLKDCLGISKKAGEVEPREKWQSNLTFIIASIGLAIGLGNLWRFPYLCYKHGGALFFIPYLLSLFFLGIPMLMLEFALGQRLQIGNLNVWSHLHPKLYGVGLATSVACYMIVIYYNVIISWALTLFFSSFRNPLPWSVQRTTNAANTHKDCPGMYISEEFFYKDILHVYNDDCSAYNTDDSMGEGTTFQWQVFLCLMLTWVICFFCVFQGIKIGGKVVWITVPLPVLLVFIFVMNCFTLKNCDYGFRMYLKGYENDEPVDINKKLRSAGMWSDACAQIFFTLSICIGCMISYASYQPENAPIITNGFAVSLGNSCFSFFAGFAVFSTVGYLVGLNSPVATKVSSIGLAFIAYPAAIETMPAANFWALMLSITLFTLGVDSAFAMVEGTVTVLMDSKLGKKINKFFMALIVCVVGAVFSTVFCFNWGFTFFDVIDHYLNVYLVLIMGILQATVVGWIHCFEDALQHSRIATLVLTICYWGALIPLAWLSYFAFPNESWVGLVVFWAITLLSWVISCLLGIFVSKLTFKQWYEDVFFWGVRPMARHMLALQGKLHWVTERVFEYWWCLSIKFVFPWAMYWLIIMTVQADTENRYGNYNLGWQIIGLLFPLSGIILFIIPLIVFKGPSDGKFKACFSLDNLPSHASVKVEPTPTNAVVDEPKGEAVPAE